MKKAALFLMILFLLFGGSAAMAERKTVEKDQYYIGAMQVVNCREYVSLREGPYKTASQLAKVPLGDIVLYCTTNQRLYAYTPYKAQIPLFIRCEYDGQEGYILKKYLKKAPEYEPAETKAENVMMTREEIIGEGETVLEWKEFNVSVLAAYEVISEKGAEWETLRVGCFIDGDPTWGYVEQAQRTAQTAEGVHLKAFMGGTEDEPEVYVYDEEYGLIMLDLMEGTEQWTLSRANCPLGDCAVVKVGENTGILYIAGTDGPDPLAITSMGSVLWRSEIDDPEVYGPLEIHLNPHDIDIDYQSGHRVKLEYNGELISIEEADSE